jgi:hypothetical protein
MIIAESHGLEALVEQFFKPFRKSAVNGYFLKDGVEVKIPQFPHVFRIFTAYQAVEVIYNVGIETLNLTPDLVQKHLVQFRNILHLLRPDRKEGSRRKTKHVEPPLSVTALWMGEKDQIIFVVFGIGKAGKQEDQEAMDLEMQDQYRRHTQLNLNNRTPTTSGTFFN